MLNRIGKLSKSTKIMISVLLFSLIFLIASKGLPSFADFYTDNIFPLWVNTYGRFTGLFPFSVGEKLIIAGIVLLLADISILLITAVLRVVGKKAIRAVWIRSILLRFTAWVLTIIVLIMNLNCFVLYDCSSFESPDSYSLKELEKLREDIVRHCNELCEEIPHDEKGNVIYDGDMENTARAAVNALGETDPMFSRLKGYSVVPKTLLFSEFMSQQYMQGYYFPFSMEANINGIMSESKKPATMCHELAHTHGYIFEDEANLIGFLACIRSEDIFFRYSGYLSVLNYVNNEYYKAVDKKTYKAHTAISGQVQYDNEFLTDEAWKKVEDNAIISTETVKEAADAFLATTLKANGVKEGKISYNHVVALLLKYY
jgi:hypothetical protein